MKSLFSLICILLLMSSCKNEEVEKPTGTYLSTHADVSLIKKGTEEDLFNPTTKNYLNAAQTRIEFSHSPGEIYSLASVSDGKIIFYEKDGVNYVRVFATYNTLPNEVQDVTLYWPDGSKDKVTFKFTFITKNSFYPNTLMVNNEVINPPKDGEKGACSQYLTIYK
ncbi:MAG: hypothetical protein KF870_01310 [Leadbetterella sp.]|nr:hypothetical protein [Leadbetterella sp.]